MNYTILYFCGLIPSYIFVLICQDHIRRLLNYKEMTSQGLLLLVLVWPISILVLIADFIIDIIGLLIDVLVYLYDNLARILFGE